MTLSANEIDAIKSACREALDDDVLSGIRPQFVLPLIVRIRELCPHYSWTGDEGPIADLGRWPRRWKCDGCGLVREDEQ